MILKAITLKLRIILQNIWRRVVGNVLMNISPSNTFLTLLLPAIFHQNCQAVLAAVSIERLNHDFKCFTMVLLLSGGLCILLGTAQVFRCSPIFPP